MYLRNLLFPAAATFGRALEAKGFALPSVAAGGARQLPANRRQLACSFTRGSELLSTASRTRARASTEKQETRKQLLSSRGVHGSSNLSRGMAATSAAEGGGKPAEILDLKTAQDVIDFWFGKDLARLDSDKEYAQTWAAKWFGVGPPDETFIATQNASKELIQKAASGELKGGDWETPPGALARLLLLDQFPRSVYRGTSQAFANDEIAASLSLELISKGWDTMQAKHYTSDQRMFAYLPLMHSEKIEAQNACVLKCKTMMEEKIAATGSADATMHDMALAHRAVVAKFGRFPHRNAALGRESTPEELEWLSSDDIPMWAKSQSTSASSPPV